MEKKEKNKWTGESIKYIVLSLVLCAVCIVLSVVCIRLSEVKWLIGRNTLYILLSVIVLIGSFFFSVYFIVREKKSSVKFFIGGYFFISFSLTVLLILQKIGFFHIVNDVESFQTYIQKAGAWMPVLYVLFQFLQVLSLGVL